jgi:hypothetical protein
MNKNSLTTAGEIKKIADYFGLKGAMPYLQDELSLKSFLETQKIDALPNEFRKYFSNLEKEVNTLIETNEEARNFYSQLSGKDSIENTIQEITSGDQRQMLESKFKDAIIHTYDAVINTGFSFNNVIDKYINFSVKKEDTNDRVRIEYTGQYKSELILEKNVREMTFLERLSPRKKDLEPILISPTYLASKYRFYSTDLTINQLFDEYWKKITASQDGCERHSAKMHLKRILGLESEIASFLKEKQESLEQDFNF